MSAKHEPIANNKPTLDWTGEAGYNNDGLNPEAGYGATTFTYRIKYTDVDNDAPTIYKAYIDKNGDGDYADAGEVNDMVGGGTTYSTGVIYSYSTTIPCSSGSTNCKYYFQFSDGIVYATGNITQGISAATAIDAPDVYGLPFPLNPIIDIRANNSDGPINIISSDILSVTVSLNPGVMDGKSSDWWIVANTPFGWYSYNGNWTPSFTVAYQGPLFNLNLFEILSIKGLPFGIYTFYFGIDMDMNSLINYDKLYYDSVEVNVTQ